MPEGRPANCRTPFSVYNKSSPIWWAARRNAAGKPLHCALRRGRYRAIRVPVQATRYTGGPDLRQPDDLIRQRTCGFLAVSCQKDCFSAALFPEKILRLPAGLSVETGKGFIQKK